MFHLANPLFLGRLIGSAQRSTTTWPHTTTLAYSLLHGNNNASQITVGDDASLSVHNKIWIILAGSLLSLITILGNLLVMISFNRDKRLQTISNYFLISLAVADLAIGFISIPLMTHYTANDGWTLGYTACQFWLGVDYLMSNASVCNLLLISLDRYFSLTRPLTYRPKRTKTKVILMIALTYIFSLLLWPPWIIAWPYIDGKFSVPEDKCVIQFLETSVSATVFTAFLAFYLPVSIMVILYSRIYCITQGRRKTVKELQGWNKKEVNVRNASHITVSSVGQQRPYNHSTDNLDSRAINYKYSNPDSVRNSASKYSFNTDGLRTPVILPPLEERCNDETSFSDHSITRQRLSSTTDCLNGAGGKNRDLNLISIDDDFKFRKKLSAPLTGTISSPSGNIIRKISQRIFSYTSIIGSKLIDSDLTDSPSATIPDTSSSSSNESRDTKTITSSEYDKRKDADESNHSLSVTKRSINNNYPSAAKKSLSATGENNCTMSFNREKTTRRVTSSPEFSPKQQADNPAIYTVSIKLAKRSLSSVLAAANNNDDLNDQSNPPWVKMTCDYNQNIDRSMDRHRTGPVHYDNSFKLNNSTSNIKDDNKHKKPKISAINDEAPLSVVPRTSIPVVQVSSLETQSPVGSRMVREGFTSSGKRQKPIVDKRQERKAARTLSAILLAFILTWTPYNLIVIIEAMAPNTVPTILFTLSYYLCYINSTVNPICYALCNVLFRRNFAKILTCNWTKTTAMPLSLMYQNAAAVVKIKNAGRNTTTGLASKRSHLSSSVNAQFQ